MSLEVLLKEISKQNQLFSFKVELANSIEGFVDCQIITHENVSFYASLSAKEPDSMRKVLGALKEKLHHLVKLSLSGLHLFDRPLLKSLFTLIDSADKLTQLNVDTSHLGQYGDTLCKVLTENKSVYELSIANSATTAQDLDFILNVISNNVTLNTFKFETDAKISSFDSDKLRQAIATTNLHELCLDTKNNLWIKFNDSMFVVEKPLAISSRLLKLKLSYMSFAYSKSALFRSHSHSPKAKLSYKIIQNNIEYRKELVSIKNEIATLFQFGNSVLPREIMYVIGKFLGNRCFVNQREVNACLEHSVRLRNAITDTRFFATQPSDKTLVQHSDGCTRLTS